MGRRLRPGLVAVITGAGSGIGRATALHFSKHGARLLLADADGAAVERTAAVVERYGGEAAAVECDLRDDLAVDALFESAAKRFGRLDVLVANAGRGLYGRVEDTPVEAFRDLLDVNVLGVHRCVRLAIPLMRAQREGHLVIVGSVNGKISWPHHGAYAATKFALTGLSQSLRMELAGSGVTCSLVLPMNVNTGFFANAEVVTGGYVPRPIGRAHSADRVAQAIVRSIDRPSREINMVPQFRLASTIAEAVPWLADAAGGWWYRRESGRR
jgi:hypothetical protein